MSDIRAEIREIISRIEKAENVRVLFAAESGSRSWGVESPDSDYDVRFVYVRPLREYMRLEDRSDVIEWQLDEIYDVNGWDLDKTLKQFHKGNATLFEWANSSVIYKTTEQWDNIYCSATKYFSEKAALNHYCGTAKSTFHKYLQGENVRYKKYIYALRPLLACEYIRNNHKIPPVHFDKLMEQEIDPLVRSAVADMLNIKANSNEGDLNPHIPVISDYIRTMIAFYDEVISNMSDDRNPDWDTLNRVFAENVLS